MRFLRRFSPLAPWKLLRTLDEVRELPALRTKVQRGLEETKRLQKQIRDERKELAVLSTRVQQFEAVYKSDTRAARSTDRALKRIGDARVAAQLRAVVAAAPLESDPCPHIVLDDLFPDDAYDVLVAAIPPPMFFEHLSVERQDLKVPLEFAPRHHREVWQAFHTPHHHECARSGVVREIPHRSRCPGAHPLARLRRLDGRRRHQPAPGHVTDDASSARLRDQAAPRSTLGVPDLYPLPDPTRRPASSTEPNCADCSTRWKPPHMPRPGFPRTMSRWCERCPDGRTGAVVFLNSTGAHRASIPSDAPPETDRYIYQLQLGPEPAVRAALNARLPAEHARRLVQKDREFKY